MGCWCEAMERVSQGCGATSTHEASAAQGVRAAHALRVTKWPVTLGGPPSESLSSIKCWAMASHSLRVSASSSAGGAGSRVCQVSTHYTLQWMPLRKDGTAVVQCIRGISPRARPTRTAHAAALPWGWRAMLAASSPSNVSATATASSYMPTCLVCGGEAGSSKGGVEVAGRESRGLGWGLDHPHRASLVSS